MRRWPWFLSTAAIIVLGGNARADDMAWCAGLSNDKDRLACFDKLAKSPEPKAEEPAPTVTTKQIIAPIAPTDYKTVDPSDLYVAPSKFIGKPIQVNGARCFYADKDEFRCMLQTGSSVVVLLSPTLTPAATQTEIEDACGAIKVAMTSARCRRTLRFVPLKHDSDAVDAMTKRIIIIAPAVEVASAEPSRRRR